MSATAEKLNDLAQQQIAEAKAEFEEISVEELMEWAKLPPLKEGEEIPEWRRKLEDPDGWRECPLFMEGDVPQDSENPAIQALQDILYRETTPEELAESCRKQGNTAMQQAPSASGGRVGPKGMWRTALSFYNEGIAAKSSNKDTVHALYANRAQVHLNLENYGHCVADCQDAMRIKEDVKCCYRAAKACNSINKPEKALMFTARGLRIKGEEGNKAVLAQEKVAKELIARREKMAKEEALKKREKAASWSEAIQLLVDNGIRVGKSELRSNQWSQYGSGCPHLVNGELHFSLLFIYDEYSTSDFVRDAEFSHSLAMHLDMMFPPNGHPAPWDEHRRYTVPNLTAFYQNTEEKYIEVDLDMPFQHIFRKEDYVCPGFLPTFHILPKNSDYAVRWRSGDY